MPAAAALLLASALSADVAAKIDAVFAGYDKTSSPGCALVVVRDGVIAYQRGYGMASLEHGIAIAPSTVFDIGSVSKQFTAAVITQLAADGKLSLDDDIRKFVSEIPDYGTKITIRNLLHHTSGIRDYGDLLGWSGYSTEDLTGDREALLVLSRQKKLNFAPGTDYSYSNSGYFLLSIIAKRAAGKSLRELMRERIFTPLGMSSSDLFDDHTRVLRHRATGYGQHGAEWGVDMSDWEQVGDGGVNTTVEDLAKWMIAGQRFIEPLLTRDELSTGELPDYSFGLDISTRAGRRMNWHDGGWAGYRSADLMIPDDRLAIAITCNARNASGATLAFNVADAILGDVPAISKEAIPTHAEGVYLDRVNGSILRVAATTVGGAPLRALGGGRFQVGRGGRVIEFRDKAIDVTDDEARTHRFSLAPPARPISNEFNGRYRSDEIAADWTVFTRDGKLYVSGDRLGEIELTPIYENGFSAAGYVFEFSPTGLTISNRGLWHLPLARVR